MPWHQYALAHEVYLKKRCFRKMIDRSVESFLKEKYESTLRKSEKSLPGHAVDGEVCLVQRWVSF